MHSQSLNKAPLRPWVIAESDGQICCAHCNCMAGLGETCSHVSALLFYLEAAARIRDQKTVTEKPAYWKMPQSLKKITFKRTENIDFTSSKKKKRTR